MSKDQVDIQGDGMPGVDEGWWTSILADEEAVLPDEKEINCRPCIDKSPHTIDWDCVQGIFQRDEVVLLEVYGHNRGGLLVHGDGIQGFVPVSHLIDLQLELDEEEKQEKLVEYLGKSLYLKVIECEPGSERIVLSERAAKAGEGKRKELFTSLKPGTAVCGVVTNVTDFGAFVDLGGVEGLIHVSEISWGRVENPADFVHIGQVVKVTVLQMNETTSRIALSIKRLTPNPWDRLLDNYHPGDVINANITCILRFGAFARLEEGIEGLIHVSSFPENQRKEDISNILTPGQIVKVKILHVDADRRRLGLGLVNEE